MSKVIVEILIAGGGDTKERGAGGGLVVSAAGSAGCGGGASWGQTQVSKGVILALKETKPNSLIYKAL